MNIIPISSESFSKRNREKKKEGVSISLPGDWWSVDVSLYSIQRSAVDTAKLFPINNRTPFGDLKVSHKRWEVTKGDYRVREPYRKDYLYYRDLKLKLIKYSVYPALIIVSTIIYFISIVLSNI